MIRFKWLRTFWGLVFIVFLFLHFDLYEIFIFRGTKLPSDHTYVLSHPYEEFFLKTNDGATINALRLKGSHPHKGVILYCHGNKDNLARWADEVSYLVETGYEILIYDYRGYGKSQGLRSESTFYSDVYLMYQKCRQWYGADSILVYGRSLGTGPACWLAANAKIKALMLETPYTDMKHLLKDQLWGFPIDVFLNYRFDNAFHMPNLTIPVFIVHGTRDRLIDVAHARQLAASFKNKQSRLLILPEAGHNNIRTYERYHRELASFLNQW